jgi:spermidine/putrescine-binding protein
VDCRKSGAIVEERVVAVRGKDPLTVGRYRLAWALLAVGICVVGCGDGCRSRRTLNVYTWQEYFTDEVIQAFEKEFKATVVLETFDSNEDLIAKLREGNTKWDIVVPTEYAVKQLIEEGLLQRLDRGAIPNIAGLDKRFTNQYYDRCNRYSVPFLWGTAGIGYDSSKVTSPPTSWEILWDEKYTGSINMLDEMRETYAVALKRLGYSVSTTNPREIQAARDLLLQQRHLVKSYDTVTDALMSANAVTLTHAWSGDVLRTAVEHPNWKYVIPREGCTIFIDNLAVPTGAPNKALAEAFINFILRPEVIGALSGYTRFANGVPASKAYMPQELRDDSTIFPSNETIARMEGLRDVGEALRYYEQGWEAIKGKK